MPGMDRKWITVGTIAGLTLTEVAVLEPRNPATEPVHVESPYTFSMTDIRAESAVTASGTFTETSARESQGAVRFLSPNWKPVES
jgi:hypothetical protein